MDARSARRGVATWQWAALVAIAALWGWSFRAASLDVTTAGVLVGAALALLAWTSWHRGMVEPPQLGARAWWALPVLAVHLTVSHLAVPIAGAILPLVTEQADVLVADATASMPAGVVALVSAVVVVPLEEVFWRGTLQPQLRREDDDSPEVAGLSRAAWRAVAATTVVGCMFHAATANVPLVGAALLGGVAWGWLRERTGGILAPMLAHAGWTAAITLFPPAAL